MLRHRTKISLSQMIYFEIAFCVLFSAVLIVKDMHKQQTPDAGFGRNEYAEIAEEFSDIETADETVPDVAEDTDEMTRDDAEGISVCTGEVAGISAEGALRTDITPELLAQRGMGQNDLAQVTVSGREYILPIEIDEELSKPWGRTSLSYDSGSETMAVVRSYQDFAMMEGYTDQTVGESVTVRLLESDAYQMKEMVDPEQVPAQEAANFRSVQTGNLGKGILYRGHSPINPNYSNIRCRDSDDFSWENNIHGVLNLNQDADVVEKAVHQKCPESYYRYLFDRGNVSAIELDGRNSFDGAFKSGIAMHLRFLLDHDGPYMVHCRMGRDRAGFVVALLQALEASTYGEIGEEYAESFRNYDGVEAGSWMDRYNQTDGANTFLAMMQQGGTEQFLEDDGKLIRKAARGYMAEIGLSEEEINALHTKLAENIPADDQDQDSEDAIDEDLIGE